MYIFLTLKPDVRGVIVRSSVSFTEVFKINNLERKVNSSFNFNILKAIVILLPINKGKIN